MVKSREYYEENMAVSLHAAIHRSLRQCITTINAESSPLKAYKPVGEEQGTY